MDLPVSYYRSAGDGGFEPTWATESPWDTRAQHGGPPSALLAHVMRSLAPDPGMRTAKVTVDFLGTVPRAPVTSTAGVVRPGRRVRLLEAALSAEGTPVALARAWEIAVTATADAADATAGTDAEVVGVPPEQVQRYFPGFGRWGYGESIEWRWVRGSLTEVGPGLVWARTRVPLVEGVPPHPLDLVLVVADSANGVSAPLSLEDWLFVPTSVTVVLHRHPVGEWLWIDAETALSGDGHGSTTAVIGDTHGALGTVVQPLFVARR